MLAGADVPGSHEEGSPAKMGTSTGNQDINYESTKRSFTKVHNKKSRPVAVCSFVIFSFTCSLVFLNQNWDCKN